LNKDLTDAAPEKEPGRGLAVWILLVAAFAVTVLLVHAPLFKLDRLHIQDMYVDQAGYITTARILADTGELRNGILLPSQIENEGFHVHMPGHSASLAASYVLFGFGVLQTLLPNLLSFVLATVGVFLIGQRLYGRRAGALAAALFALFPANIVYAFTAMAELTFTAAVVTAFLVFVHLPRRWQPFAACVLLIGPFLFRESGAFVILPMALLILRARGIGAAVLASGLSVASLYLVNRWQIANGKIAASLAWVTEGGFNYGDPFAPPPEPLSTSQWFDAVGNNFARNLHLLGKHFEKSPGELMPWCLYVLFAIAAIALVAGILRIRRDLFPLGAALLLALVFLLSVALYDVKLHKMMRSAMFAYPLGVIAIAGALMPNDTRKPSQLLYGVGTLLTIALCTGSHVVTRLGAGTMTEHDDRNAETTARIAWLNEDDKVIVAPNAAAQYAVEHYPVLWSQRPSNERALGAVMERYDVGVILISRTLSLPFLAKYGLRPVNAQGGTQFYMPVEDALRLEARLERERSQGLPPPEKRGRKPEEEPR
jgi:hypothetical protein